MPINDYTGPFPDNYWPDNYWPTSGEVPDGAVVDIEITAMSHTSAISESMNHSALNVTVSDNMSITTEAI